MHEASRATLVQDLNGLLAVGRDRMDMLYLRVRLTSHDLIVMAEAGAVLLCYAQTGWLDVRGPWRFWRFGTRNKLSPRFERWGRQLVHLVALGSDAVRASQWIEECFATVYNLSGPYALEFTRQGWSPTDTVPPN
jgi:hypothetical protein